jgi:cytochrome c oxidase subunit 2
MNIFTYKLLKGGHPMKRWLWLILLLISVLIILSILAGCARSPGNPYITPPEPGTTSNLTTSQGPSVSNGQRIYFYSTSDYGDRVTYTGGPGMMMQGPLACVTCHGADGHGGRVNFMMQSYDIPNITWPELTGPDPDMEHPPYTEETLKQVITQGIDPGGSLLEYPMPRWQMSEQDLNDLVNFIKTLK